MKILRLNWIGKRKGIERRLVDMPTYMASYPNDKQKISMLIVWETEYHISIADGHCEHVPNRRILKDRRKDAPSAN